MPYPSKKFRQNPFTSLRVIRWRDRQTDRTKNITSFFGGGNNSVICTVLPARSKTNGALVDIACNVKTGASGANFGWPANQQLEHNRLQAKSMLVF